MKRIPRPVLRALEALAQSPIHTSALAEESKLALLEWAEEQSFQPEGVLFDAWYTARQVLERQKLSFYQCRRRLIAGKLSLDLSLLLPVQVEAA